MFLIGPYNYAAGTMVAAIQRAGATSGLVACLDAGDINSYDGTSQTWTDVSGQGNSFFRGSGSGSDGFDPTFHGSAGAQSSSEYFQTDAGDAFWQASSLTFMNAWHKDNAAFTMLAWIYLPSVPVAKSFGLFRNFRDATDLGVEVAIGTRPFVTMMNAPGSGNGQIYAPSASSSVFAQWMLAGVSFSEGSGASFAHVNGAIAALTSDTYSSPSASAAPNGVALMGLPDTAGTALDSAVQNESSQRINSVAAWNRALSQSEVLAIYAATKAKFGL